MESRYERAATHDNPPDPGSWTLSDSHFIDLVITPLLVGVGTALFLWYMRNRSGWRIFRNPLACVAAGLVIGVINYIWKASI
ncbi:MAG: hypothetical protein AAF724_04675 [Pseudomonadota bacterium]